LFLFVFFYVQLNNFIYDPYKQPAAKGIAKLRGYYRVKEFRLNNVSIPYSQQDSLRWQDVTFEKWTTLSFKQNKPVVLDLSNGGGSPMRDINRTFELAGVAGGRRVFYYEADTVNQILYLQDKNRGANEFALAAKTALKKKKSSYKNFLSDQQEYELLDPKGLTGRRRKGITSERAQETDRNTMVLNYSTTDGKEVVLSGINEDKDSVYVVLQRLDKKYALKPGKLSAGKY